MCLCSGFGVPEKKIERTARELDKLFPYKARDKAVRLLQQTGMRTVEKSYPTRKSKIDLHIITLPSKDKVYAKLDEIKRMIPKKAPRTISDEEKKKLLKEKEKWESEIEKLKAMYKRYLMKALHSKEEGLFFSLRCEPIEGKVLKPEDLLKLPQPIRKFLGAVEQTSPEFVPTRGCLRLVYDSKKFKLAGGFSLPTKIPLPQKIVERLGEANLSGLHLSFKDSPLNFNRIEILLRRGNINIFAEFSAKMHISEKVCKEVYEYGVQASNLFAEGI